jgi:hypothetical protein
MANFQISGSSPIQPIDEPNSAATAKDRFDPMYGRMRGTIATVEDVVAPDSEDHRFNLYEDLRTRLHGTVTVLGEIVKSDPELWSDDR